MKRSKSKGLNLRVLDVEEMTQREMASVTGGTDYTWNEYGPISSSWDAGLYYPPEEEEEDSWVDDAIDGFKDMWDVASRH